MWGGVWKNTDSTTRSSLDTSVLGKSEGILYHQGYHHLDDAKLKIEVTSNYANDALAIGTSKEKKADSVMIYSLCAVL